MISLYLVCSCEKEDVCLGGIEGLLVAMLRSRLGMSVAISVYRVGSAGNILLSVRTSSLYHHYQHQLTV